MHITTHAPRAMPARGTIAPAAQSKVPQSGGLSAAEIRQIVLDILG